METNGTVYFVGDVGEEGPGNLRGTRNLVTKELKGKIDYFITVDGAGLGIASRAVGSNRYRVTYKGPGGHSYGAFGIPNPIHALGRAIAAIGDIQVPTTPKTTFNVGIIEGGTSVNSISAAATMEVDMRSEDAASLAAVDVKVQKALHDALAAENARWTGSRAAAAKLSLVIDTMGIRPTGAQSDAAPIVQTALSAAKALGFTSATSASSTDANLPISLGIPAIRHGRRRRGRGVALARRMRILMVRTAGSVHSGPRSSSPRSRACDERAGFTIRNTGVRRHGDLASTSGATAVVDHVSSARTCDPA